MYHAITKYGHVLTFPDLLLKRLCHLPHLLGVHLLKVVIVASVVVELLFVEVDDVCTHVIQEI